MQACSAFEVILVDTSIWTDHLRHGSARLTELLHKNQVLVHPMVMGELACGQLSRHAEILTALAELPQAVEAGHSEVLQMIENHQLAGCGLGWVDMHLLASSLLCAPARLWTADTRLAAAARSLG